MSEIHPTSLKKYKALLHSIEKDSYIPKTLKKPPVLNPLTQAEWDQLEGKARWDSTVALRGPDLIHSDTLKWFTTSVIRFRLSKVMRVGGLVNNMLGFVVLPGDYLSSIDSKFDASHFLNHVREAASWLGVPICYCSNEIFNQMLEGRGQNKIMNSLYESLSDSPYKTRIGVILNKIEGGDPCQE